MSIFTFVTQEELDNLDEDPRMAFLGLVNHAQRSLSHQLSKLSLKDEGEWKEREDLEQSFMNVLMAAGKRFEIEPFLSTDVPQYADYRGSDYKQFKSDLDHYVTQLVIDNSLRSKKTSVAMLPDTKDKIKGYVHGLRDCIEKSSINPQSKTALLTKLEQFEKELEKRRVNILEVTLMTFAILGIPGATWASVDIAHKLIVNITQAFADAKAHEDQARQLQQPTLPKALSSPRGQSKAASSNLDEEIPF